MSAPTVSVVMPTRNRADVLSRAIDTVLAQTFANWELIIVDDASTDATPDVLAQARSRDARIRSIRMDQRVGASRARNTAIDAARSDLIAFLDDDDEWFPEKLHTQVAVLRDRADAGVCCTHFLERDADGVDHLYGSAAGNGGDLARRLRQGNVLSFSTPVVRRSLLELVGGLDERLPRLQDWDLWLRLSRVTRFAIVPVPLARVHRTAGSISHQPEALRIAAELLLEKDRNDPALGDGERADLQHALGQLLIANGLSTYGRALVVESLRHPWPPRRVLIDLLLLLGRSPYRATLRARDILAGRRAAAWLRRVST